MVAAGWSNLTQLQLRDLLRSHGQPTDGSEAALAQRVGAFMNDDHDATAGDDDVGEAALLAAGPSASEAAALQCGWSCGEASPVPRSEILICGQSCNGFSGKTTQKLAGSVPSPSVGVFPCYSSVCPSLSGALVAAETAGKQKTARWSPVI